MEIPAGIAPLVGATISSYPAYLTGRLSFHVAGLSLIWEQIVNILTSLGGLGDRAVTKLTSKPGKPDSNPN